MITIEKCLDLPDTYPLERIGKLEELLFFDIETTGFSGAHSNLYLIGCTYYRDGGWHLIQWFADTADSEEALLHAFFGFLGAFKTVIHFNGDTFDIPYLLRRCAHYHLPYSFSSVASVDIYKRIRPYRRLLGPQSMKQKSIEQFLGVSRSDKYSGGELTCVYQDYLMTRADSLYDLLILHNEDDLKGMPLILPILSYPDFFEHPLRLKSRRTFTETDVFGAPGRRLELVLESDYDVPVPFSCEAAPVSCEVNKNRITFTIELFDGTLKHFYPNYKDYYYLIYEDTAVHKSVGEYVDKSARVKATAQTCYTKKEGCFLPQFEPVWEPVMKHDPKDKLSYVALDDVCPNDESCLEVYVKQLLTYLIAKC